MSAVAISPSRTVSSTRRALEVALAAAQREDRERWVADVQGALCDYAAAFCAAWARRSGASDPASYAEELLSASLERSAREMLSIDLGLPGDEILVRLTRAVDYGCREGGRQVLGRGRAQERVRRAQRDLEDEDENPAALRAEIERGRTARWNSPRHVEALLTGGASVAATWLDSGAGTEEAAIAVIEHASLIRAVHLAAACVEDERSYERLLGVLRDGGRLNALDATTRRRFVEQLEALRVSVPAAA